MKLDHKPTGKEIFVTNDRSYDFRVYDHFAKITITTKYSKWKATCKIKTEDYEAMTLTRFNSVISELSGKLGAQPYYGWAGLRGPLRRDTKKC